jgi:spoIIIJ-associated protein
LEELTWRFVHYQTSLSDKRLKMNTNRANLEVIAPTIEEAIAKGLADLGLPLEAVEVETLDEGSRGLFGLGSRHARVRLTVKNYSQRISPLNNDLPVSNQLMKNPKVEVEIEYEEFDFEEEDTIAKAPVRSQMSFNTWLGRRF